MQRVGYREQVIYIEEYRDIGGLQLPARVRQVTGGDEKYAVRLTLEEARLDPPMEAAPFEKPPASAPDVHFPAGVHSVAAPFEFSGDNIWVQARVNSSAPQWFIFDTGAEMSGFNAHHAAALGLKPQGALGGRGLGEKSISVANSTACK